MTVVFIAVVAVMAVMNSFMFLVLKRIVSKADRQMQRYFLKKLEVYDDLYDEKAKRFQEIINRTSKEHKEGNFFDPYSALKIAALAREDAKNKFVNYRNIDFLKEYKAVKNKMQIYKEEVVVDLAAKASKRDDYFARLVNRIQTRFSFDTFYKIATMTEESQKEILEETLLEDEKLLLREYCQLNDDVFDYLGFFNYLKKLSYQYDPKIYVKTGEVEDHFEEIDERIVTEYDAGICEGIRVVSKNVLYDYSI